MSRRKIYKAFEWLLRFLCPPHVRLTNQLILNFFSLPRGRANLNYCSGGEQIWSKEISTRDAEIIVSCLKAFLQSRQPIVKALSELRLEIQESGSFAKITISGIIDFRDQKSPSFVEYDRLAESIERGSAILEAGE